MMKKKERIFGIVGFYMLTLALFAVGTFYDLRIDRALYNPENGFALFLQKYGEVPRFALWGPASAVLYATRAWECETTVSVIDFFKRKLGKKADFPTRHGRHFCACPTSATAWDFWCLAISRGKS